MIEEVTDTILGKVKTMTFDEIWEQVEELKELPNTAISHIPLSLSESAKRRLSKLKPAEIVRIIQLSVDQINKGSVETLESLIRKQL